MKYMKGFAVLFIMVSSTFASCQSNKNVTKLSAKDYDTKLQSTKDVQLIDVRTPEEYKSGHLPNAVNIDWNGPDFKGAVAKLDKSKPTFVYCLSGARSGNASSAMAGMGFTKVYQLKGGIRGWMNEGKPTTLPADKRKAGMSIADYTAQTSVGLVLVDFNAPWCPPCKEMAPVLEQVAQAHKDQVKLVKINVDENNDVATSMKVETLPVLILYKAGNMVWQHEGLADKVEIEAALNK